MNRRKKPWVFTRSTEFQRDGSLRLGHLLADPYDPATIILPEAPDEDSRTIREESTIRNVYRDDSNNLMSKFGLWSKVADFTTSVGLMGSLDAANKTQVVEHWKFTRVDSILIAPSKEYVQASIDRYLNKAIIRKRCGFLRRVYMITGLRVVESAQKKRSEASHKDASGSATGFGQVQVVTLEAGAKGRTQTELANAEIIDEATNFVFAYRLHEIFPRKEPKYRPFREGETI
ncbi:hypothetical protein BR93DRAFT_931855 [Coniochaeta sp. PMI_546]|nr:hypothetical protein BR93DRAFT_931855 [Coniochaeta sp. PMI_546]